MSDDDEIIEEATMPTPDGPTDRQIDAALAWMDHVLGPGWIEEGEAYWAAYYREKYGR
jgi:hypothetical protein